MNSSAVSQGATNDATRDTTPSLLSRQGVALPDAAKALGVSLRTVQRRLDRGDLGFIERDGRRFVLLEGDAIDRDTGATSDATPAPSVARHDTTRDTLSRQGGAIDREREAELKEEIRFLRGLVEQRDRDAAELRAALREALRAQPRQLPAATARNGQEGPQNGAAPESERRAPTTYAEIADLLEAELNQ